MRAGQGMRRMLVAGFLAAVGVACVIEAATTVRANPQPRAAAPRPGAAEDTEQEMAKSDPALHAAARQYFPGIAADVPSKRIFRLTRDQIDVTVASLLPGLTIPSVKEAMPRDLLQTNYEYADILSLNAANIGSYSGWVTGVAAKVRERPASVIDCASSNNSPACLKTKAHAFLTKAYRGDAATDTLDRMTAFYLSGVQSVGYAQATGELVEVGLNSPNFLFRKELEVNQNGRLSPAQLLQAVTYTLADAPPERLGLDSGRADDYLRSSKEAAATIGSIVASKESREKILRFFMAWLEIKEAGDFTISQQSYPEFTPQLAAAMRSETRQFLRAQLEKPSPSLKDITQSTKTFVPKSMAQVYGETVATSTGSALVDLDPAQRLGIFSQPAVLASHSGPTDTRPIKRGVFWVRKVMCMEMDAPPLGVEPKLVDEKGLSERQRIEQSTSGPACSGCHKVINPFAFFQENYDALGRWRTVEHGKPIDPSILVNFLDEEPVKTSTPVEALKLLTSSLMFKQCFVRQLFRFYMGRSEEPSDHPLLRRMLFEFVHNDEQDILRTIQVMASSDRIVRRQ